MRKRPASRKYFDADDYRQACLLAVIDGAKYDKSKGSEENYINTIITNTLRDSLVDACVDVGGCISTKSDIMTVKGENSKGVDVKETCAKMNINQDLYESYMVAPNRINMSESFAASLHKRPVGESIEDYIDNLDDTEKTIMRMSAQGCSQVEISGKIGISPSQVRSKFDKSCKIIRETHNEDM